MISKKFILPKKETFYGHLETWDSYTKKYPDCLVIRMKYAKNLKSVPAVLLKILTALDVKKLLKYELELELAKFRKMNRDDKSKFAKRYTLSKVGPIHHM